MFAYIKGEITHKTPAFVYLETNGIGYHINISLNTFSKLDKLDRVRLYTYFHVKEDAQTLYGFFEEQEKELFSLLISVSGIGPNTARIVLSSMEPPEVKKCIIHEDVASFNKVKGIGPKTAKRIILDLKDKVLKTVDESILTSTPSGNPIKAEALSALQALGFQKKAIEKTVDKLLSGDQEIADVEQLIKLTLKQMS